MKKKVFFLIKELIVIPAFLFVLSIIICNFISIKGFNLNRNFLFDFQGNIQIYLKSFFIAVLTLVVLEYFISFKQDDNHLVSRVLALFTVVIMMLIVFEFFIYKFNVYVLYLTNIISVFVFEFLYMIYHSFIKIKNSLFMSTIIVILLTIVLKIFIL